MLIVLSGGPPSSSLNKLKEISTSLKSSVDIWTIGSGPESSSQYLKDMASSPEQSHKSIFFENLSPFTAKITQKMCSGKIECNMTFNLVNVRSLLRERILPEDFAILKSTYKL